RSVHQLAVDAGHVRHFRVRALRPERRRLALAGGVVVPGRRGRRRLGGRRGTPGVRRRIGGRAQGRLGRLATLGRLSRSRLAACGRTRDQYPVGDGGGQGPHHDAQMFTTTGLPRSCVSSDWNAAGSSRGSAVGLEGRSEPEGPSPVSLGEPPQAEASSARAATIIATTDRTILVRFIRLLLSNEDCRFEADAILRPKVPFYLRF